MDKDNILVVAGVEAREVLTTTDTNTHTGHVSVTGSAFFSKETIWIPYEIPDAVVLGG